MSDSYSVRVDRKKGLVEVSAPDRDWVEAKLRELGVVRDEPKAKAGRGKKVKRGKKGKRAKRDAGLEGRLTGEVKLKLMEFADARRAAFDSGLGKRAAIIATFLNDELGVASIDGHDLHVVCTVMGWPVPGNTRAALANASQRDGYFTGFSNGKVQLTRAGQDFGRHDSIT